MPSATYEQLLAETAPARIETDEEYDRIHQRFSELLTQGRRTKAEERLMDLLGTLIQDFDRRHALPADASSPAEILQFLVEQSGKPASELLGPVFGSKSHVSEALSGKRPISAGQARKLAELFSVKAGLFL